VRHALLATAAEERRVMLWKVSDPWGVPDRCLHGIIDVAAGVAKVRAGGGYNSRR
jgi:hypothetical protein